jgi:hypothetical protein
MILFLNLLNKKNNKKIIEISPKNSRYTDISFKKGKRLFKSLP